MGEIVSRRPAYAIAAMLVGVLAFATSWTMIALPTGEGEAGFATLFQHVFWSIAAVDALAILWAILSVASLRRSERGVWYLLAGFIALVLPAAGLLVFSLVQGPLAFLVVVAFLIGPPWSVIGLILLTGKRS